MRGAGKFPISCSAGVARVRQHTMHLCKILWCSYPILANSEYEVLLEGFGFQYVNSLDALPL